MNEIIEKIEKNKNINLNDLLSKKIDDVQILAISTYINTNNVSIIRDSNEFEFNEKTKLDSDILKFFENLKNREYLENINDSEFCEFLTESVIQTIKNIKIEFSFKDLISETYYITIQFMNEYYNKLKSKYNKDSILDIFRIYCTIKQLNYQNESLKEEFNKYYSILMYLKLDEMIKNNEILTDEQKQEYESLKIEFSLYDNDIDESIEQISERLEKEKDYRQNTYLFDYLEENAIIDYLLGKNYDETIFKRALTKVYYVENNI